MTIDNELIERLRKNDRKAMQELYGLTVRYLFAVCQRYVVNEEDVRDILQETYIKTYRNIGDFKPENGSSLVSWMTRIAVNESLMLLRRKHKDAFIETSKELPDREEDLEVSRFSAEQLHNAIQQLPTGYRVVLNLYAFEDKSHKEIAQLLGIKEASSASQLHRAKNMLRKILLKQEGGRQ